MLGQLFFVFAKRLLFCDEREWVLVAIEELAIASVAMTLDVIGAEENSSGSAAMGVGAGVQPGALPVGEKVS